MIRNKKTGVIILAAGNSSRLGHPKQLVEFGGEPLLQRVINMADSFEFDAKVVVLGANSEVIENEITPGNCEIVINYDWKEGMASSIRKGLNGALELQQDLDELLILLSDQPFVSRQNIEKLIEVQLEGDHEATFSEYAGDIGVPAIFSKKLFSELMKLKGDQGAKKLIYREGFQYAILSFEKGKFDVDTKEDVEILKNMEE